MEGAVECCVLQGADVELVAACTDIQIKCFPANEGMNIISEISKKGTSIICAVERLPEGDGRRCLGFIWTSRRSLSLSVSMLVVHPCARRRGVGRNLLMHVIGMSRQLKISMCSLHVDESNTPAIELYRSVGFVTQARKEDFYSLGRHALSMELELQM